ncbi:TetR family transcriptional regulator [Paractinoplanes abujensis]|uniref:AcrR family transcriptional regulator n=1 Tax=Paractinoplanes abujensis TaxID=882441 RepID=A0A7W7G2D1_9ACTN|nr:helix-turn-helix domain-containing protein [Actinoplanes abujensis]MBB4693652.1 AcrR family transcriptional regulator [Actinoplanes abujensis]GID21690.1 TetR family transcriptional regulator [Actinoplanes abujensis]
MTRRPYDNTRRAEQARLTRRRVLDAARALLVERGPAAVTMRDVATGAGVSAETVYKTFGTKAALVKDVYDVTLAGDDEDVPMIDRPEIRAVHAATSPQGVLTAYAHAARLISGRTGPLLAKLLAAARGGDPDLAQFRETINRERMVGASGVVRHLAAIGGLRAGVDPAQGADIVWTLIAPEVYELLVGDRGWTLDQYERWLAQSFIDALT